MNYGFSILYVHKTFRTITTYLNSFWFRLKKYISLCFLFEHNNKVDR